MSRDIIRIHGFVSKLEILACLQEQNQLEDASPYNGVSKVQAELPKLSLRDMPEENSFSSMSSPAPGPLSPPLGPMNTDIGDLHDVPINDNTDTLSTNIIHSRSLEEVCIKSCKYVYVVALMLCYLCAVYIGPGGHI